MILVRCQERFVFCLFNKFMQRFFRMNVRSITPYTLVDIGANLGHPAFRHDYERVLERAKKAGNVRQSLG